MPCAASLTDFTPCAYFPANSIGEALKSKLRDAQIEHDRLTVRGEELRVQKPANPFGLEHRREVSDDRRLQDQRATVVQPAFRVSDRFDLDQLSRGVACLES